MLRGGRDDDHLLGGSGNDRLYGDAGIERILDGGPGRDVLRWEDCPPSGCCPPADRY